MAGSDSKSKWLKPWGPKRLREIIQQLQNEAEFRTPIPGCGIDISETATGREVSTKLDGDDTDSIDQVPHGGGASSASASNVIATEFVTVETALTDGNDEELYSHGIGAGRMKTDGDSIRAVYSVRCQVHDFLNVFVTFGTEHAGALIAGKNDGFDFAAQADFKIDILIMRTSVNSYRFSSSTLVSIGEVAGDGGSNILLAGAAPTDNSTDFTSDQFLTLWGAAGVPDATPGMVKACLALIEYIPA